MDNDQAVSFVELETILQLAGKQIHRGTSPADFLEWFRDCVPALAPQLAQMLAQTDGGSGTMFYCVGRAVWNAMPQPSNHYRPRPLPKPNRNGRCPCGSGRKFKQCCDRLDPPHHLFESMNLLRYVLDRESLASLKRIDARAITPAALDDVARHWASEGKVERALLLLEPLFKEGAKPPRHAELLLDTLFDIWPTDLKPKRRSRLAERLSKDSNPAVACVALHRHIVMLADSGDMQEAWIQFHEGLRQYPQDVNFAAVEIMLLLTENRLDEAQRRAEFWVHYLRRLGSEYHPYADRLMSMVEIPEDDSSLDRVRAESPLIDALAKIVESQPICVNGYRSLDAEEDQPIVLISTPALERTEQLWLERAGCEKPSLIMLDTGNEPLAPEQIFALLEQDPSMLNSFDVLDDISESLDQLINERDELGVVLELIFNRAETLLLAILTDSKPIECVTAGTWQDVLPELTREMPWAFRENRPAMRLMARHIYYLKHRVLGSIERWLPRAQVLLAINPNDNHTFRELVSNEFLRQQKPVKAKQLLDNYPNDFLGAVIMNQTLALFCLNRHEEAAIALRNGGTRLRELRKSITHKRYARPRDTDNNMVAIGSREEAWQYRQDMHATWHKADAIKWLLAQPKARRSPKRSPDVVDVESLNTDSASISTVQSIESATPGDVIVAEYADEAIVQLVPLSCEALQKHVGKVAPHGPWVLGLALVAALTPGGGFAMQRLLKPILDRFEVETTLGANTEDQSLEDLQDAVIFNEVLINFMEMYKHFTARVQSFTSLTKDIEPPANDGGEPESSSDLNWIATDLSVVSLEAADVRIELVSGIVAGIDGNPRGWSPIPDGPRNNVIGPLRLLTASAENTPISTGTTMVNATLFDLDKDNFQMDREECLQRISELVELAKLTTRAC